MRECIAPELPPSSGRPPERRAEAHETRGRLQVQAVIQNNLASALLELGKLDRARFQVERKDQQIQLLQKDRELVEAGREKDRILRRVLIGGGALLVGAVIVVLLRYRSAVRTRAEIARHRDELKEALDKIQVLEGLLPIGASCKNTRDDDGHWKQVEGYLALRTGARFTHSICPSCSTKLYPEFADRSREPGRWRLRGPDDLPAVGRVELVNHAEAPKVVPRPVPVPVAHGLPGDDRADRDRGLGVARRGLQTDLQRDDPASGAE